MKTNVGQWEMKIVKMQHDDKIFPTHTESFPGAARNYRSMQYISILPTDEKRFPFRR